MKPISKKLYLLIRVVSVLYGLALLYILFLRSIGATHYMTYREYLAAASNFIPFFSVYVLLITPVVSLRIFLINFVGNILLFVPWGFLLPLNFESLRAFKRFICVTLIAVLLIESIQLFTMLGSFDVEDILLNAIGACIGFLCCKKLFFGGVQA